MSERLRYIELENGDAIFLSKLAGIEIIAQSEASYLWAVFDYDGNEMANRKLIYRGEHAIVKWVKTKILFNIAITSAQIYVSSILREAKEEFAKREEWTAEEILEREQ
jgi:F0F1-type ATP synthase assembly protein I